MIYTSRHNPTVSRDAREVEDITKPSGRQVFIIALHLLSALHSRPRHGMNTYIVEPKGNLKKKLKLKAYKSEHVYLEKQSSLRNLHAILMRAIILHANTLRVALQK